MKMKEIGPGASLVAPCIGQNFLTVLLNSTKMLKLCEGMNYLPVSGAAHFCHSTKYDDKHGDPFAIATFIITKTCINIIITCKFSHMFDSSFKLFEVFSQTSIEKDNLGIF